MHLWVGLGSLNLSKGQPRSGTGFGLSPLFWGMVWTHSALFSFKIWEQTKTSCCSFSADIKGHSLPTFQNHILTFGNFAYNSCVPWKKKLVSSSPNRDGHTFMQCCQWPGLIQNIWYMVYMYHWQHCTNDTEGHIHKELQRHFYKENLCKHYSRRAIASLSNSDSLSWLII